MNTGRRAARTNAAERIQRLGVGQDASGREPARRFGRGLLARQDLNLIRQHQMRDPAAVDRPLDRESGEFGVVAAREHGLSRDRDIGEDGRQVEILKRPATAHRRRHLPRHCDHRGAIQLRVVEPGQQVRRARPGDRETHRRSAGELAVGTRRERRCALVPDTDVGDLAAFLSSAQRIGETEVRMANHPEHVRDPEGHQRLDEGVADGAHR
jgi:hypothetical protein